MENNEQRASDDLPPGHQAHEVSLVQEPVRVDIGWQGEGVDGEYNPERPYPEDRPLYRFDVYVRPPGANAQDDEWEEVPNSSFCCAMVDTSAPRPALEQFALMIMEQVHGPVSKCASVKLICQELTWTPMETIIARATAQQMCEQTPTARATKPGPFGRI